MNYPFDQHSMSQQNSRNEFMIQQQSMSINSSFVNTNANSMPNDMDKLFSYMKNVMSNPLMMEQMEKFLAAKQAQKNSSFVLKQNQSANISRIQNQIKQSPQSYVIQTASQQKPQPLRMGQRQNIKKIKSHEMNQTNLARKKGSNDFSPYTNEQIAESKNLSESNEIFIQKFTKHDQRPITTQQKKIKAEQKPQVQAPKQAVSFDDIPIKSNYAIQQKQNGFDMAVDQPASYPQNQLQVNQFNNKRSNRVTVQKPNELNKYKQAEQRPINGTKKDFKQLLKEKFVESPFDDRPIPTMANNRQNNWMIEQYEKNEDQANEDENNDNEQRKPRKQFLKRGSRQYLSSAKDKKSVAKISQETKNKDSSQLINLNNSRIQKQKTEREKTPTKRDVSQNRVLSKRNTNNNDKSVSKFRSTENPNNLNSESFYEQKQEQTVKRSITPKNEKINQKSKSPILPPKSNKPTASNNTIKTSLTSTNQQGSGKKKNVFDDSSSDDEEKTQNQDDSLQTEYETARSNNHFDSKRSNQNIQKRVASYQPQKQFNMFSREKKQEVIEGVYLTKAQLETILQKHLPKNPQKSQIIDNSSEQKFNQLRKKYTDLCKLVQQQKIQHEQQMQKQREEFQNYKQQQMQKIKNERRVMQRQVKSSMPSQSQNLQKDKEEVQNLKKQLEKERDQHKKKEKNNKILIEKYKKENQELKFKLERLEDELEKHRNAATNSMQNNFSSTNIQRQTHSASNLKSNTITDKSKSKVMTKDVSPGKGKTNKANKNLQDNEEDEINNDRNYKKTVPLYKGPEQKKSLSPSFNESIKKNTSSKAINKNEENSSDDDLPTFKVDNKKEIETKVKTQKKYHYVENSVETNQAAKKQNTSTHSRMGSSYQTKTSSKNVFADESDEQVDHQDQKNSQDSGDQQNNEAGFFKSQARFQSLQDLMTSQFSIKSITPQMIEKLFKYQNNVEYVKYMQKVNNPKRIIVNSAKNGVDKKITNIYNDKSKEILFENGVKKQIFQDGYTIIYFKNGDVKQKLADGTTLYYFKEKQVDQITLVNGLNIYRFDNNQVELHYDGGKYIEIRHPDGTIKMLGSPIH